MFKKLPVNGLSKEQIFDQLKDLKKNDIDWKRGRVFSLVFYPGEEAAEVMQEAYRMFSMENGLNPTVFKSLKKMEADIIAFSAHLLNAPESAAGTMTSGGTESIICAVKAAKNYAKTQNKYLVQGNMVLPESAHPAFHKAANYFDIEVRTVKCLGDGLEADMSQFVSLIDENTVMIVGSAPAYPHGIFDPLVELSALAMERKLWLHIDACVGGFIIPFLELNGYEVPIFDFRLPGVSSISLDIHKYGYGPKGSSVVLYRHAALRKKQFYVYTQWTGGLYVSPSVAGTRPGGAIAGSWAIMNFLGVEGYKKMARETFETVQKIKNAVHDIPGLQVVGNPLAPIFSITSTGRLDIYRLGDVLSELGWHLDRQLKPPSLHLTISYGHVAYADEFIRDLRTAVEKLSSTSLENFRDSFQQTLVKQAAKILPDRWIKKLSEKSIQEVPQQEGTSKVAPLYGLMGELSGSGTLEEMVLDLMDGLNQPSKE
jgi:glutamate/tyrosine decarboxylase-like PLP-dependent enzyme